MPRHRWLWVGCASALMGFLPAAWAQQEHEWRGGKWVPVAAAAKGTPEGELSLIRKDLEQGRAQQALREADEFLKKYPQAEACEEVMVLAGQAEMDRGRYYQAFERFEEQIQRYPNGRYFERVLSRELEIAEAFLGGKKRVIAGVLYLPAKDDGLEILTKVAEHAPRTVTAERALLRIAEYYSSEGRPAEAATAYDRYLDQFDKSRQAPQAMLKAAQASYAAYRGVPYDETPLLEAELRFRMLAERHPAEAVQARVQDTLEQITNQRAGELFATGGLYERMGRPQAAAFYYKRVTMEYPQAPWAKEARSALTRLGASAVGAKPAPPAAPKDKEGRSEK